MSLEIDAPLEDVWKALTNSAELSRWFPLEGRVEPGLGGSIFLSWGKDCEGTAPITIWEPKRRLQFTEQMPMDGPGAPPTPVTVDYFLEGKGGTTILRLVHSGMGKGANWDGYLDSITRGWKFELRGLRHYLEHHRGKDRHVVWVRQKTALTATEAAGRIIGPTGHVLRGNLDGLGEGDRYRLDGADGDLALEGLVQVNGLPRSFAATAENLSNSYFRFELEGTEGSGDGKGGAASSGGGLQAWLWLSTYAGSKKEFDEIARKWTSLLREALAC
jgi:uncharacterized protein YndB with AHSA1/START domain